MKRIYIIGTSGSGKTYLASQLSRIYDIPSFDLDDIYWEQKYSVKRSEEEKKKILSEIIKENNSWIMEGVFTSFVSEAIENAEKIIWLNFGEKVMKYRIIKRSIKNTLLGKDSLKSLKYLLKDIKDYKKGGVMYEKHKNLLASYDYILIKNKKQLKDFINKEKNNNS